MEIIKPPRLKNGDKVGIISPSMPLHARIEKFEKAVLEFAKCLDVDVVVSAHARGRYYYSSGTVEERLEDFHQMLKDPSIKAIIFSVGGNTAIDLVDKLDYSLIKKHPKIISGISDATTLLNPIFAKTGLITFLGSEFSMFGWLPMEYTYNQIKKTWFKGEVGAIEPNPHWTNFDSLPTSYKGWECIREGVAKGRIIGGNFPSFQKLYGTNYSPELEKNIFVLETYQWNKRAIHHELMSMRLKDDFKKISGMIVGYCVGSDDPSDYGNERLMKDMLLEVTEGYDFPIMQIGEIGHKVENIMLPIGSMATIDTKNLKFIIDESVVS
jgi:muramoyltetrapeptide carboxypeptidase